MLQKHSQWILLLLVLLSTPRNSLQDDRRDPWNVGHSFGRRNGRRLLTRDLNMEELFVYWQKMHAHWPNETYQQYLEDYRRRVTDEGRQWGLPKTDADFLDIYYFLRNRTEVPVAPGWTPERDRCPPACRVYGTCHQELGRCDCPRGREGPDCATPKDTACRNYCQHDGECHRIIREWCINECNGRGSCVGGVCHCYPGYFGADCSLSIDYDGRQGGGGPNRTVLLAGLGYRLNPRGPRIFVYEFPPQVHLWTLTWIDRPLNVILWERITSAGLRVTDPAEADYFFLPGCGRGCNDWDAKFKFIMEHYPQYWHRRHGRDHLMTHTGDWGRCERSWGSQEDGRAQPYIQNLTMLNHWGITVDRSKEADHDLFIACHKPNQDIQIPVLCGDLYPQYEYNVWHPSREKSPINKTHLASLTGSICAWNSVEEPPCSNRYYSLGVRAALWSLRDRPGFLIAKRVPIMGLTMAESEFCFAPTGAGHGKRNVVSVSLGCMPVIISDHVAQPYEPFLNWNDFGVWIPESHIEETELILRGFTAEQKKQKMERLYCAARHISYTSVFGGLFVGDTGEFDAIATLVNILRARLRNPGVPDHKLMQVDEAFADFMACKSSGLHSAADPSGQGAAAGTPAPAPPPAPPLPNAAIGSTRGPTIDDIEFPDRTVTTADWIRSANGPNAGTGDGFERMAATESRSRELCYFNGRWVYYADHSAPEPDAEVIAKNRVHGQCMPKNANRPGGFFPGGSVACPPSGRPITECAWLM